MTRRAAHAVAWLCFRAARVLWGLRFRRVALRLVSAGARVAGYA